VAAGAGEHLRAVEGDGDLPDLEHPAAHRQFEHLREAAGDQRPVLPAERANRVVIGVGVAAEQPHGHVLKTGRLDPPAPKHPGGVAVDQQREHHPRRILRTAAALLVDARRAHVELLDGIENERHQMIRRHPLPQIGRQQHRGVSVDHYKAGSHASQTHFPSQRSA